MKLLMILAAFLHQPLMPSFVFHLLQLQLIQPASGVARCNWGSRCARRRADPELRRIECSEDEALLQAFREMRSVSLAALAARPRPPADAHAIPKHLARQLHDQGVPKHAARLRPVAKHEALPLPKHVALHLGEAEQLAFANAMDAVARRVATMAGVGMEEMFSVNGQYLTPDMYVVGAKTITSEPSMWRFAYVACWRRAAQRVYVEEPAGRGWMARWGAESGRVPVPPPMLHLIVR